ncbi:MAG: type II toxin-antitoxin system prevent-host-death family antitoxin [Nocardioidaceae bacterium]|nr:type II toxin-antitoxin system prevent-host-death family antitoxin [Nocardioidaceae bacterium]MCL2612968.1 type II toxin-antitoxin system prevent-host-death family antitoxin [Nocardioidaceae bacterium]
MSTVGAYDAKTHLPRLLAEVEKGEIVTITRHGTAIARLVPVAGTPAGGALADELRQARRGVRRGDDTIADMLAEGRR